MTNTVQKQSQELANQLWAIANDLRGNMDASKFKNYILGVIFYRYLSERTESYMNDLLKGDGITYREALKNEKYAQKIQKSIDKRDKLCYNVVSIVVSRACTYA